MKRNEKCDDATAAKAEANDRKVAAARQPASPTALFPLSASCLQKCSSQTNHSTRVAATHTPNLPASCHEPEVKTQIRRLLGCCCCWCCCCLLLLLLLSSLLLLLSSLPLLHLHLRRSQQQGNSSNCKSICKLRLSLVLSSLFSASRSLHSRLRCPLHAACCRLPAG